MVRFPSVVRPLLAWVIWLGHLWSHDCSFLWHKMKCNTVLKLCCGSCHKKCWLDCSADLFTPKKCQWKFCIVLISTRKRVKELEKTGNTAAGLNNWRLLICRLADACVTSNGFNVVSWWYGAAKPLDKCLLTDNGVVSTKGWVFISCANELLSNDLPVNKLIAALIKETCQLSLWSVSPFEEGWMSVDISVTVYMAIN